MFNISVVVPVYNSEKFVEKAVRSVLEQTYEPIEVIVVNDGSSDYTTKILADLELEYSKVRILNQSNQGAAAARNRGIEQARGDWIAFMDADDISKPNRFEVQVNKIKSDKDLAVVGSRVEFIDASGAKTDETAPNTIHSLCLSWMLLFIDLVFQPTWLAKTSVLKEIGGYDEDFTVAHDFDLIAKINRAHKISVVDDVLVMMRKHDSRITSSKSELQIQNAMIISKREQKLILGTKYNEERSNRVMQSFSYYQKSLNKDTYYDASYLCSIMYKFINKNNFSMRDSEHVEQCVARKIWNDGRMLSRSLRYREAENMFGICKNNFGYSGVNESKMYILCIKLLGGVKTEKILQVIKDLHKRCVLGWE